MADSLAIRTVDIELRQAFYETLLSAASMATLLHAAMPGVLHSNS